MSTYAIGDLQGCYIELCDLLKTIKFNKKKDQLWFVGDLINRGPHSLDCLRFVKSLGKSAKVVLGNHELHLLAVAYKARKLNRKDTLNDILEAKDAKELIAWVRQQPLLVYDPKLEYTMVHAGLPMQWTLKQTMNFAKEAEKIISGELFGKFVHHMYGDKPDKWSESLKGHDRYRYIINCLSRMRFCRKDGSLDMKEKGMAGTQSKFLAPWYSLPKRKTRKDKIIFGHWSTLTLDENFDFKKYNVFPLDTGCLWHRKLTAMRLEDEKFFSVPSKQTKT